MNKQKPKNTNKQNPKQIQNNITKKSKLEFILPVS